VVIALNSGALSPILGMAATGSIVSIFYIFLLIVIFSGVIHSAIQNWIFMFYELVT
jgi:hypothetical protein